MSAPAPWWKAFFDSEWGRAFPALIPDEQTCAETDTLEARLALDGSCELLDVPCGYGRHALELSARGHRVTGVELNTTLLEYGRGLARERGLEVTFEQGDMRELRFDASFDAAFCYFGSFGYFEEDGNRAFLAGVARALRPGGRFLLDTHSLESLLPQFRTRDWSRDEGGLQFQERHFDLRTSRVEVRWTYLRDERRIEELSSIRLYSCHELGRILDDVGFDEIEFLDATDSTPFEVGSQRLHVVARRAEAH